MHVLPAIRVLLMLLAASPLPISLFPGNIFADTVYKSIDKDGRVTYSSSPAQNHQQSVKLDILPPPSEDSVKAARQRHQQNLRADKIFDENRQQREQKIAKENHIKRERQKQLENQQKPEKPKQEGPYYGIPGHGILVLPGGARINP